MDLALGRNREPNRVGTRLRQAARARGEPGSSRNVYVPATCPNPAKGPVLVRSEHVLADTPDGHSPIIEPSLSAVCRLSVPDATCDPAIDAEAAVPTRIVSPTNTANTRNRNARGSLSSFLGEGPGRGGSWREAPHRHT